MFTPRPYQAKAHKAIQNGFAKRNRLQVALACGTGKTFVSARYAESSKAQRVLVLVPTLKDEGKWPHARSGDASDYFGHPETWRGVQDALREGWRGLTGGSSLAQLKS